MKESIIRTLVPIVYALLLKLGIGEWLGIESEVLSSLAALATAGVVYAAIRFAESKREWFGWLLGYAAAPTYVKPGDTADKPLFTHLTK